MKDGKAIGVALSGNPNSGKTSIFNALTGARQHVGNYPGVTVEMRSGKFKFEEKTFEVMDLPGTYSLSSFSPEERIAQDELLQNNVDVVVLVVDSTALKRSLVLLAQIMQTGANPVLCLNMADEAKKSGLRVNVKSLGDLLGFPVVSTVGHKAVGISELKQAILKAFKSPLKQNRLVLGERLESAISAIRAELTKTDLDKSKLDWVAVKLLTEDTYFIQLVQNKGSLGKKAIETALDYAQKIKLETNIDISLFVMERYYGFVDGLLKEVIERQPRENSRVISDRIDSILVNRILGIPFFLAVMYAIFYVTFSIGEYPMGWIESGFGVLADFISSFWQENSDSPVRSLLVDGIIGGVGGVVIFLPNIVLLFAGLAILEDTGYMARAAFLVDRLMHRFGLHGKSFIPMMTGFGCSIPGIMATRTMENEKDRLTTMMVLPLMSCGARLPIWMLLIPAFFAEDIRAFMLWSIYMIGIVLALLLALVLRRTVFKGEEAPFVMELPPYRLPTFRAVTMRMFERSWLYLKKAGTIILGISIIMWVMTSYPKPEHAQIEKQQFDLAQTTQTGDTVTTVSPASDSDESVKKSVASIELEYSLAGRLGKAIEPIIKPLGFDWKIGVAMVGAFAAKEVFVSQMGIIYSMGEDIETSGLSAALKKEYSPLVGFSLMLFLLISAPCMATIAVTRRESGSWKWAAVQLGGLTAVAYIISFVFYQVGQFFV